MKTFADQVYAIVKKIPRGEVMTYAQVATALGQPTAARAVGNALHRNPDLRRIPCHRVVRSDGTIGGYVHGRRVKALRLESEGARNI